MQFINGLRKGFQKPQRGFLPQPRVARIRATLGRANKKSTTPTGLPHDTTASHHEATPLGLNIFLQTLPRVARIRATLGYERKPLWGCSGRSPHIISVGQGALPRSPMNRHNKMQCPVRAASSSRRFFMIAPLQGFDNFSPHFVGRCPTLND